VAQNTMLPDDRIAIAVLTNQEASSAASQIAKAITSLLISSPAGAGDDGKAAAESQAKSILQGLIAGKIDRSLFTEDCNVYFSREAIGDFRSSLAPLGPISELTQRSTELRGGMRFRAFTVKFGEKTVTLTTYTQVDGKLEQFLIEP
jgi:D-alanyl-D-alanine carboxypeptidase